VRGITTKAAEAALDTDVPSAYGDAGSDHAEQDRVSQFKPGAGGDYEDASFGAVCQRRWLWWSLNL